MSCTLYAMMETERQNGNVNHKDEPDKASPHEEHALLSTKRDSLTEKGHERKGSRFSEGDIEGHGHGIAPDHSTK